MGVVEGEGGVGRGVVWGVGGWVGSSGGMIDLFCVGGGSKMFELGGLGVRVKW